MANGVLHFDYTWESSTGNLADLSNCLVGEFVTYPGAANPYVWPSPPWAAGSSTPNPTMPSTAGSGGAGQDNHGPKSFVAAASRVAANFTATQIYRYQCPCANGGNWVTLDGPISIVRTVTQNADGTWQYAISKSGSNGGLNPIP